MSANDATGVAKAAGNLGAVYLDGGRLDDAEAEFNVALDAARRPARDVASPCRCGIWPCSRICAGETEEACARLRQSLALCVEIDAHTEALELRVLMGQIGCL